MSLAPSLRTLPAGSLVASKPVGDVNMTPIFCQKGNEKSGLTPLQKKTSSPLLIDVGVDSSLLWITIVSKEPQIIMATCLITVDDLMVAILARRF